MNETFGVKPSHRGRRTDGLPPKLTPTTATNRVNQGTTRSKVTSRNTRRTASVNAYEIGNYVHLGTSGNNEVQHLVIRGPVAQRPRAVDS